MEFHDIKRI